MKTIRVRIEGTVPILMHNGLGADPTNPFVIEMKKLTSVKKKTFELYEKMKVMEMKVGMYYDEELGPYLPAELIETMIVHAARKEKQGKSMQTGILVDPGKIPLEYEGTRDFDEIATSKKFMDCRPAANRGNRIIRTRPSFFPWAAEFDVQYIPDLHNPESIFHYINLGGHQCGVGDYRPRFGRFESFLVNGKGKKVA